MASLSELPAPEKPPSSSLPARWRHYRARPSNSQINHSASVGSTSYSRSNVLRVRQNAHIATTSALYMTADLPRLGPEKFTPSDFTIRGRFVEAVFAAARRLLLLLN